MATKHEFNFGMTCGGCSNAAKKVLGKIGVDADTVECSLEKQKLFVTSDKSFEELREALKKTGKTVEYVGTA